MGREGQRLSIAAAPPRRTGVIAQQLSLPSADSSIELAAAGKIRIATAQGAAITIEGGNITFEAPGSITYRCGMRTLAGPKQEGYALPEFP